MPGLCAQGPTCESRMGPGSTMRQACQPQLGRSENDHLPVLDPKTMTRLEIIDYIFKEGYPEFIAGNYPNFTKEDGTYKSKEYLMKHTTIKELYMLYDDIINETHMYC